MAKKAKVEADKSALDAVESALSIDFNELDNPGEADLAELEKSLADTADKLRESSDMPLNPVDQSGERFETADDLPDAPPAAANDEHGEDLKELLYAIQKKPNGQTFFWASIASLVWLGICAYYGYTNVWPNLETPFTFQSFFGSFQGLTLLAIALVPLMPLWGLSIMLHRALEMRQAAGTMTQVSLRLLQPEKIASDSVATVGTAIRREMTAIGDGVERAIARAGELEFMVQKEVMNLERSYGDSEVRLRRLIDEIGNEREEVINHAEKLRTSISESQNGLTNEIEIASHRIEETIKNASGALTQSMDTESLAITSRLKDTSEGLIEILSRTGEEISDSLGSGSEKLKSNVDGQIREMSEVISTSGQAIATLIDGRTASFDSAASELTNKLETGKKAFDQTFSERANDLGKILATAGQTVSTLLKSSSAEMTEKSNQMLMDLEDGRKQLENTVNHQSEQFEKLTSLAANNMTSAIEAGSDRFEEVASKVAQQAEDSLSIRASDFNTNISETAANIEASVADNLERVSTNLSDGTTKLGDAVSTRLDQIEHTLTNSGNNLVNALGMRTEALDKVLKERTDTIGETIAQRLSGFGQSLTGHVDEAVIQLKSQTDELQEKTKSVEEIISKRTKSVEDTIRSSTIEFATGLKTSLETTAEKSAELNTALTTASQEISQSLESSKEALSEAMSKGTRSISDKLDQTTETLDKRLAEGAEQLSNSLTEKQEAISTSLETSTKSLQEALDERANNLASKLNQGVHRVSSALVTKGTEVAEELDRNVSALEERLNQSSFNVERQFEAGNKILGEKLEQGESSLLETISKSVTQAGSAIDGKAEKLSELLNERAEIINNTLGNSLVETQRQLESKTSELDTLLTSKSGEITSSLDERLNELNSSLSERSSELSRIIEQDAKPIVASIEATGNAINNKLADMSKTVAEEANTLFASLANSNTHLEELINSATNNLSLMQSSLIRQSSGFADTVEVSKSELAESNKIALEVEESLKSATTNLTQNMASIANRLEAQGSVLQDATRLIDAAQTNLEQTLGDKQQSLQDLASGLVIRSDEINNSVTSFASSVSSMVDDIHSKSLGTGHTIAAEVSTAIDDATARFSDSVEAMRSAAATIRKELDETREQMRRGVLELPDETAQNAAAMRRVVTDQIAALKDLSSLVERSGRVLDTSSANVVQASGAGVGGAQVIQQAAPTVTFPPDTVRANAPAPIEQVQPQPRMAPVQPVPQQPAPVSTRTESGGWVSDLLRRASSDEPQPRAPAPLPDTRSPDHMVESLNSLSMDIASAIDHEASIELWERYQRGETNVFTRRLYTLQGQQTFDEIRRKYAQNGEFRNAVDRYIDDFERLLSDVSKSSKGGTMAQSYLTSDTGKVYTMLAHAAGRFGNQ